MTCREGTAGQLESGARGKEACCRKRCTTRTSVARLTGRGGRMSRGARGRVRTGDEGRAARTEQPPLGERWARVHGLRRRAMAKGCRVPGENRLVWDDVPRASQQQASPDQRPLGPPRFPPPFPSLSPSLISSIRSSGSSQAQHWSPPPSSPSLISIIAATTMADKAHPSAKAPAKTVVSERCLAIRIRCGQSLTPSSTWATSRPSSSRPTSRPART